MSWVWLALSSTLSPSLILLISVAFHFWHDSFLSLTISMFMERKIATGNLLPREKENRDTERSRQFSPLSPAEKNLGGFSLTHPGSQGYLQILCRQCCIRIDKAWVTDHGVHMHKRRSFSMESKEGWENVWVRPEVWSTTHPGPV